MRRARTGLVMLAMLITTASCSTDTDLTDRPLYDNGVHVFEAQVVDARTGAQVQGATVTVQVGRHVIEATDDDTGFFTAYGIPYGEFRITAVAEGYNNFQALKSFTNASPNASLTQGDPLVYYFNNILMYPEGTVPQGINVAVYNSGDGATVAGATVVATLESINSAIPAANALAPNVGLVPSTLTATTDSEGKASLDAANLVLGGQYEIDVYGALDADGVYLVPAFGQNVTVGESLQEVAVFLERPFLTPVALTANNEDGAMTSTLVVTFPYPVEICSNAGAHNWTNSTPFPWDTNSNGIFAQPAAVNPVTASLADNSTMLTLEYAVSPSTDDPGDDLYVTFTGVAIRPRGSSDDSCTNLGSVPLRNLDGFPTVDLEIHVRDVP